MRVHALFAEKDTTLKLVLAEREAKQKLAEVLEADEEQVRAPCSKGSEFQFYTLLCEYAQQEFTLNLELKSYILTLVLVIREFGWLAGC